MSEANAERALLFSAKADDPQNSAQPPFRIRAAQRKDLPQIVSVLLASFYPQTQANPWLYWLMRIGIQEDIKTRLKTPANQYVCLVAAKVDPDSAQTAGVVGTAEISQRPCETWRFLPPKRAYLSNLAITHNHRRKGAAQQLIRTCETVALGWGFHRVYLHVMANNTAAKNLYQQAGYQTCEVSNPILSGLGLRPERLLLSKQIR